MIASGVVGEIRCLLDRGEMSQRKIAVQVGVSRGTVSSIARGKRPDHEARQRHRGEEFVPPSGQPRRWSRLWTIGSDALFGLSHSRHVGKRALIQNGLTGMVA